MAAGKDPSLQPPHEVDENQLLHPNTTRSISYSEVLQNKYSTQKSQAAATNIAQPFKPFSVDYSTTLKGNNQSQSKLVFGEDDKRSFHFGSIDFSRCTLNPTDKTSNKPPPAVEDFSHLLELKPKTYYQGKPSIIFHKSDKHQLLAKLRHILVGKFSHGRPSLGAVKSFFSKLSLNGAINISIADSKHVFLECDVYEDFVMLWMKLVWTIGGFPMRMFKWTEHFHPSKESTIAPIWIHLPGLPLYLFEKDSLLSIANVVGKPLKIDIANLNRSNLGCASICVEIDVSLPVIDEVWIQFVEEGIVQMGEGFCQKVVYNFIPSFCCSCAHLGHTIENCKRIIKNQILPAIYVGSKGDDMSCRSAAKSAVESAPAAVCEELILSDVELAAGEVSGELGFQGAPAGSHEHAGETAAGDLFPGVLAGSSMKGNQSMEGVVVPELQVMSTPVEAAAAGPSMAFGEHSTWKYVGSKELAAGKIDDVQDPSVGESVAEGIPAAGEDAAVQSVTGQVAEGRPAAGVPAGQTETMKNTFVVQDLMVQDVSVPQQVLDSGVDTTQAGFGMFEEAQARSAREYTPDALGEQFGVYTLVLSDKAKNEARQPNGHTENKAVQIGNTIVLGLQEQTRTSANSWAVLVEEEAQDEDSDEDEINGTLADLHKQVMGFKSSKESHLVEEEGKKKNKKQDIRISSQLSPSEVKDCAKKELAKVYSTPTSTLPSITNLHIPDKDGNVVPIYEIIEKSAGVSELSHQLTQLRNMDDSLKGEHGMAILMASASYDKYLTWYTIEILRAIKEHTQTIFFKASATVEGTPLSQKQFKNETTMKEQEWSTAKSRVKNRKRTK